MTALKGVFLQRIGVISCFRKLNPWELPKLYLSDSVVDCLYSSKHIQITSVCQQANI